VTIKIYGPTASRAARALWIVHELGIPFEHVAMEMKDLKGAEYLKVNPNGHVPSIDDDGLVLHESLAINLYLAKKHGGPLAPANIAEDGEMGMWSLWAAIEVEPHSINVLYHRIGNPMGAKDAKVADTAVEALKAPFAVLDRALAKDGWLVGGRFTVADINAAEIVRYAQAAPELLM
jgi:glutathione S-transferase